MAAAHVDAHWHCLAEVRAQVALPDRRSIRRLCGPVKLSTRRVGVSCGGADRGDSERRRTKRVEGAGRWVEEAVSQEGKNTIGTTVGP